MVADHNKTGQVLAVCKNSQPGIPKIEQDSINLIKNFGVEGDYHAGKTIRHRYLARKDPLRKNNRQVLVIDARIISDIATYDIFVKPGQLGENIFISDMNLMNMPTGSIIRFNQALVQLTEIRHPCAQLNAIHPKLMDIVMPDEDDPSTYNAGVLGIILEGDLVKAGDPVTVKNLSV